MAKAAAVLAALACCALATLAVTSRTSHAVEQMQVVYKSAPMLRMQVEKYGASGCDYEFDEATMRGGWTCPPTEELPPYVQPPLSNTYFNARGTRPLRQQMRQQMSSEMVMVPLQMLVCDPDSPHCGYGGVDTSKEAYNDASPLAIINEKCTKEHRSHTAVAVCAANALYV